ncbi:MAG: hypothetical protein J6S07_06720 [Bacteroidaceae bacterium]|nr:hypothetical protein [Bacteroidaceae bacterium]
MQRIFIILSVSPHTQVASQKSATGTMGMRSIVLRELGGQWANSYAVKVFSPQAEQQYSTGDIVAASLRFRHSTNQVTGATYQDVVAEEIVKLTSHGSNNLPNKANEKEIYETPF